MKKIQAIVFMGLIFMAGPLFAAGNMFDSKPATQSFQEADPTAAAKPATPKVKSVSKAKSQHHKATAKASAQNHSDSAKTAVANLTNGLNVPAAQATTPAVTPNTQSTPNNNANHELQDQLNQLSQNNLLYQQRYNQRIETLSTRMTKLQQKMTNLVQAMSLLNQEFAQAQTGASGHLSAANQVADKMINMKPHQAWLQEFVNDYGIYVIIALLVVIVLMLAIRRRSTNAPQARVAMAAAGSDVAINDREDDIKDEYDFMGSTEAIPAKLDLAHAYIAMEDYHAARKVLRQVIAAGNPDQQKEAKEILDKIAAKR